MPNNSIISIPMARGVSNNLLINGDFKINQRGAISRTENANEYNYDRWYYDGTNLIQPIEEGNYKPSTTYTLSGDNITTEQLTSPVSGSWNVTVPTNADNVKLEEGNIATAFESRPMGLELFLCQRYYQIIDGLVVVHNVVNAYPSTSFLQEMRVAPSYTPVFTGGSGATFFVTKSGMYQNGNHSIAAIYSMKLDSEIAVSLIQE
jgi:hypothetical protein